MSMSDPISDYLTRIRNAQKASKSWVDIPCSNLKIRISYVLKEEKFIKDHVRIKDSKQDILRIYLKYDFNNNPVIHGLKRISSPGCRRYVPALNKERVFNGLGISILTTPKGVMSNKKASKLNVGGELLCQVW